MPDIAAPVEPRPVYLTVQEVTKRFGRFTALDAVSLEIREGEFVSFLGPSGCGKTTLLRAIAGLDPATSGRIVQAGRDITVLPPGARDFGIVFQSYALFPNLDVRRNIAYGLRGPAWPRAKMEARVAELVSLIGLEEHASKFPAQLSGGQQQRVALARTLATRPRLILLDEPFSNLDARMRVETRQEVRRLLKEAGSAGILVTHDQEEALALADRIALMEAGRVVQIGTPDEIYRNPATAFVASFLGRSNILRGTASGMDVQTAFGRLPLSRAANGAVDLAVRPEQILIEADPAGPAIVTGREFRGHDQLYWVQEGERCLIAISGPGAQHAVGSRVRLRICDCVVPLA